jgi:hypothetical protein
MIGGKIMAQGCRERKIGGRRMLGGGGREERGREGREGVKRMIGEEEKRR